MPCETLKHPKAWGGKHIEISIPNINVVLTWYGDHKFDPDILSFDIHTCLYVSLLDAMRVVTHKRCQYYYHQYICHLSDVVCNKRPVHYSSFPQAATTQIMFLKVPPSPPLIIPSATSSPRYQVPTITSGWAACVHIELRLLQLVVKTLYLVKNAPVHKLGRLLLPTFCFKSSNSRSFSSCRLMLRS